MRPIRVLSWNVCWQRLPKRLNQALAAIESDCPDILILQELPTSLAPRVRDALAAYALRHVHFPGEREQRRHGVLIAARHPLRARRRWARTAKFPWLLAGRPSSGRASRVGSTSSALTSPTARATAG